MEIYAIINGRVMSYILDPDFEDQLPIIPSEVESVNFTWRSPKKKYFYNFDLLSSFDQEILQTPLVSIRKRGRVPRKPKVFSVRIPCAGNVSGMASFGIGLNIENVQGEPLPGTPLRLRLRKYCELEGGPDPECDKKCSNGGVCDENRRCLCPNGYMGQFCNVILCYPQCRNGGICSAPGRCTCPLGYHGRVCEGGICRNKCLNGGKCVQKDTCKCPKGFYGNRCEFSTYIVNALYLA
ncbi:Protein shifted [Armadillidium vulgare]|nr:Protein shifted [Armadillidium vulgare]